eukprot:7975183-Pyramimonas_sp.AAC.1
MPRRRTANDILTIRDVNRRAGVWHPRHAEAFARLALKCTEADAALRPNLESEVLPDIQHLLQ